MSSACLLYRLILDGCNNRPQAPAIQASGKKALSYRELSRHLQSTALQFSRLGIRTGDRLAVVLRLASQVYGIKFKIKFHLDNLQDKNILEILKYTGLLA
jgi:non-ribosomal peptide synthetase component E (peptide arylation enzyme)